MNKYFKIIATFIIFTSIGCRSVPKKDLSEKSGIIAAQFHMPVEIVKEIQKKGFSDKEVIQILIIAKSTHLTVEQVINKVQDNPIKDIAQEMGISTDVLEENSEEILEKLTVN
ncbi:MAG: hypothetical protein ACOC5T_01525 [Elusimicrobiota bacterium]